MDLSSLFKSFDVHVKAIDGVRTPSLIGGIATVLCTIIVVVLVISEFALFLDVDVHNHMAVDVTNGSEPVFVTFDVHFHHLACSQIELSQHTLRGNAHNIGNFVQERQMEGEQQGCTIRGSKTVDKVAGNLQFEYTGELKAEQDPTGKSGQRLVIPPVDLSHTINELTFVDELFKLNNDYAAAVKRHPELANPLRGHSETAPTKTGLVTYGIQVIPTRVQFKKQVARLNQYSVSTRHTPVELLYASSGVRQMPGVWINYDFYPVMVRYEEEQETFFEFVTSLCAILGGIVTAMGLVGRFLRHSSKVLAGKAD